MNVNILISILLNLSDGKNITEISVADGKNASMIHVFIDTNITNIDPPKYTNVIKVTSSDGKNSSVVTRFDYENVTEATTFDIPEVNPLNDTNICTEVSLNTSAAVTSGVKNISKDNTQVDDNVSNVTFDEEKITSLSDELYKSVVAGRYDDALSMSIGLDDRAAVTRAVTNLIDTNPNNTMDFAYRLWTTGGKDIVTQCFPPEFKAILNGDPIRIVSKDIGSPLTLSKDFQEQIKPILELREVNKVKASWTMIPIWENGNSPVLYFKIRNIFTNLYLYANWLDLGDGLRGVWAYNDAYTEEHLWLLKPVAKNTFKIINRKYPVSLAFNHYYAGGAKEGWVWASDEQVCKKGDSPCSWSYEWVIEPLL